MFGLLGGLGGAGGGLLGMIPIYGIFFVINLVIQFVAGNLDGIFMPPETP